MCSLNVNLSNIFISNLNTCLTLRKKGKKAMEIYSENNREV